MPKLPFRTWLASKGEERDICNIPPALLDIFIGTFLETVNFVDKNGVTKDYEPDSLTSLHRGIARYLRESKYSHDIITSPDFEKSRKTLEARRKELKCKGLGNKPNKADALTPEEENRLWSSGQLNLSGDARVLQNTIFFLIAKLLGFRGADEHRQLAWGDLQLKVDMDGNEYLQWNERKTKTRNGQPANIRPYQPKIYCSENKERCPIECFKLYASHRPAEMKLESSPFYLSVKKTKKAKDNVWCNRSAMGKNYIGKIMKEMCLSAGIKGNKTNHSIRKTMCTNLLHAGVPPTLIQQLSGHKNVQSVNNYATASEIQQREMCKILQNSVPQESSSVSNIMPSKRPALQPFNSNGNSQITSVPTMMQATPSFCTSASGPFTNAQISGGTFHLHFNNTNAQYDKMRSPIPKRRRAVIYDSDED